MRIANLKGAGEIISLSNGASQQQKLLFETFFHYGSGGLF